MSTERPSGQGRPGRSRLGKPYRRIRRWGRHTPNGEIALTMIVVGVVLAFIAAGLALFVL